jgi:serine/threonine protein kinase
MSEEHFGRYIIKGELGRGGMATVFHAYDPRFERDVAIKVLPREFLHDPQFRVRFEREAKTIALIEHPAIVPVYDFGEEEGQPYIVMRYMSGGSLADRMAKGSLPVNEAINMINRLAPALDAAHSKGIVHRDLKPGNILYDQYGNSFLSDFGIARFHQSSIATLTGGAILGTPAYMSPEQVQGEFDIDGRSDIYSLGVILYQVLTGKVPYHADTAARVMMMHILEPVPQITTVLNSLPASFDDVIRKAMAKDPKDRFTNTLEMANSIIIAARGANMPTLIGEPAIDFSKEKTNFQAAAEVSSPTINKKENRADAMTRQSSTPITPAGAVAEALVPQTTARRIPAWVWAIGAIVLVGILITSFTLGGGMSIFGGKDTATATSDNIVPIVITDSPTPSATATFTSIPIPTDTPTPTSQLSETPAPTDTPIPPTDTPLPVQSAPVIGGADKVAFLSDNEIYIANLDGQDLIQLTFDRGVKSDLSWTPDGSALAYITGLCIKNVDIESTRIDELLCFEYANSLDGFEISPDGQQLAIVINHNLFVVPMDREKLDQVRFWDDIRDMATCAALAPFTYSVSGAPYYVREVHWSNDQQRISIVVLAAEGGLQVDVVRVLDISQCVDIFRVIDEFPTTRFTMAGYENNPRILHLGYDGQVLFALTTIVRNEGFGDLYLYNMDVYRAQARVNPIDGHCCYRDPEFSPDGSHLIFAFQDITLGSQGAVELYYIPYGTIGTGLTYTPIALPTGLFTNQRESPQPVLRPVITSQ